MDGLDLTLAICVYNAERFLTQTLESVCAQTMQGFRLLIVNDCSTDNSVAIIESFFQAHPRQYELVNFTENKGIAYARHFAERKADTHYMMFLDADDVLRTDAIEKMYGKITSDADLMAVGCHLEYIDAMGRKIGGGIYMGSVDKSDFYERAKCNKLIFMQTTAIYDRQAALSVGGFSIDGFPSGRPRYQDYCEDLDLWTRMSDFYTDGKAIVVIPEVLCSYRKTDGLSSDSFLMLIKMRYTKSNLLRRRSGDRELTFSEFFSTVLQKQMEKLQRESEAAGYLRNGVFYLRHKQLLKAVCQISKSIFYKPSYILGKIRHNTGLWKK